MSTKPTTRAIPIRVRDAMHEGIVGCGPAASMRLVAQIMAEQRVHAVVVRDSADEHRPIGLVSAIDVVSAVATDGDPTAGEMVTTAVVAVAANDSVERAAQLMAEQNVDHLIVIDGTRPVGVISSLDVARLHGR